MNCKNLQWVKISKHCTIFPNTENEHCKIKIYLKMTLPGIESISKFGLDFKSTQPTFKSNVSFCNEFVVKLATFDMFIEFLRSFVNHNFAIFTHFMFVIVIV